MHYSRNVSAALVALYLAAIVAANLAVAHFGPAALALTAFVLIPFDLVTRDVLHERWSHGRLWPKMAALVFAGSALSCALNLGTARIALASCIAFAVAGALDTITYAALKLPRLYRMNASNAASALADSLAFPAIAFGVFDIGLTAQQAGAKFLGGIAWSLAFVALMRARRPKPATPPDVSDTPTVLNLAAQDLEELSDESDRDP